MGHVRVALDGAGTAAEVAALWESPSRWPGFVDGCARIVSVDPGWPAEGTTLVWESHPSGRGRVSERVIAREFPNRQATVVGDAQLTGTQTLTCEDLLDGVEVALELDYTLIAAGAVARLTDTLFVRRALGESLRRTLRRLLAELDDEA